MKCIQVNIKITNQLLFEAKVDINNLSREDSNQYEEMVAMEVEQLVHNYFLNLRDVFKKKNPELKSEITIIK